MGTRVIGFNLRTSPDGINQSVDNKLYDGTNVVSANFISEPFWVERVGTLSIQFSCPSTGTPNGSFVIQGSNDSSRQETNNKPDSNLQNWATISFLDEATGLTAQSKAVSGAVSLMATIQVVGPRWMRLSWTNTSGTVTPTIRAQAKSVS